MLGGEQKERKKTDNPREGWEDGGTPPPHRDFKERSVVLAVGRPPLGVGEPSFLDRKD